MSVSVSRPDPVESKSARVPGGFETDTEGDFDKEEFRRGEEQSVNAQHDDSSSMGALDVHEPSSLLQKLDADRDFSMGTFGPDGGHTGIMNNTVLEEQEMNRRLGDFESSFIPELSHLSISQNQTSRLGLQSSSQGDLLGFGERNTDTIKNKNTSEHNYQAVGDNSNNTAARRSESPRTPPAMYMTPAPEQQEAHQYSHHDYADETPNMPDTSALENMSSSLTAARTVSRVQSMATIGGYETADEHEFPDSPTRKAPRYTNDPDATPRKNKGSDSSIGSVVRAEDNGDTSANLSVRRRRPKYLSSRSSNARLSYDSMASSTTETSDATLGADFALQTGGAAPESRLQRKPRMTLSRSTSLGSIVSGVSNISDDEGQMRKPTTGPPELSTLQEESPRQPGKISPSAAMITPKASNAHLSIPTDTVVTNHVRDLEVPGSFARQYRQNLAVSPEKQISMTAMTPSAKKGLTLKEHRSTVEKLGKENFDLKMKIHFLDQALQRRSEDGVKEMITENVQLKSDRMRLEKENHSLRKQNRELQKRLEAAGGSRESLNGDPGYATDEERSPTMDEEVVYLRERVETTEIEIERLRSENMVKETEKRRLAEMVRSLGDGRTASSDVGSREERDMWKDMLESETIAREQSEEENKRLKDEVAKLRQDTFGTAGNRSRKGRIGGSVVSQANSVESSMAHRADAVENDRLRHEISELQKMISAQASTLTSRNKEKERLYQEIEDLKLGRISGIRSVAGDSILDRSASRARSNSRVSNGTRFSRMSESEREQYEIRIGELRDEVSNLRLDNQNLQSQFEQAIAELDAVDAQAQVDVDAFNEELMLLQQERDNALRESEDQDEAFQTLKNEAQEEIDGLGDELDAKVEECNRLEEELRMQADNAIALQNEVRSASEGLVRLEQDAQQNLSRYQNVKAELDDAHRQLKTMEENLNDAETKIQRFTVQQESSHNEIAFLREEQDTDKIKIGDMESLLKKVHLNLDSERDRSRDFERRLTEERSSHEVVASQEKQEVQRVINDLNREASGAKDELRKIRKALSSRDIEVTTYKERLIELEDSLRQILGDSNATRSSIINTVNRMQRDLQQATNDLDKTTKRLDDHQNLLVSRDALLESTGLECRKMADLLERERQARRQDKHSFEQSLRSHQQAARALSANTARINELEQARSQHRKQLAQLETQFKDQLAERNSILLTIWKKLSALCGPDWAHNHSLINGNLPSQEVVGNMLFWPGFSRNLLLASKQVESSIVGLRDRIKAVERNMWKEYNNLEHTLELRSKKLERIEESWEKMKLRQQELDAGINLVHSRSHRSRASQTPAELQKLKGENRLLKAELQLLQQQSQNLAHIRAHNRSASRTSVVSGGTFSNDGAMSTDGAANNFSGGIPTRRSSINRNSTYATGFTHASNNAIEQSATESESGRMSRTDSTVSGHGPNSLSDWPGSPERSSKSNLMLPARPFVDPQPPSNGNFARPPYASQSVQTQRDSTYSTGRPSSMTRSDSTDAATLTSAAVLSMNSDSSKWIHRLRELERRLKTEREQRLIDRTGMRKRLEEREAVNEELRRELERERLKHGFGKHTQNENGSVAGDDAEHGGANSRGHHMDGTENKARMGLPSLNNRVVEVEGSPVRGRGR